MNVILNALSKNNTRRRWLPKFISTLAISGSAILICNPVQAETHANLQAVNADGTSAWNGTFPFTMRGVLLSGPDEMLDSTPNFIPYNNGTNAYRVGAEWQVTFQAVDKDDRGGSTCYMGQNYGNMPWIHSSDLSYTNEAWVSEIP